MRKLSFLLLIVASFSIVQAQTNDQPLKQDAKATQEIQVFEKELSQALEKRDRAILERMVVDDFTFIHSTGYMETRKEYLDNATAGNLSRQQLNVERFDEQIRIYEGRTAVRYSRANMRNKTDNSIVHRMRNVAVYAQIEGRWQWVSGQSTKLPLRPQAKAINTQVYDLYVGQYTIDANRTLTVTKENEKLIAQVTGRPGLELIPKSETEFIRYSDDNDYGNSEIVFIKDAGQKITHAVYRSDHKDVWRAKRLK